jgi:GTP-binding protein HflX
MRSASTVFYLPRGIKYAMARQPFYSTSESPKTLIVGVIAPYNRSIDADSYFSEFKNLVKTNRGHFEAEEYVKLRNIDPAYFITRGKLDVIRKTIQENGIQEVIISDALTNQQHRNLEEVLECKVYDRTHLILEIFERAATSAEGKKQVEVAKLQYQKSRLAGKGISMSQQSGLMGTRGPGETAKENEIRYLNKLITRLKRELEDLERTRIQQRKRRLISGQPQIALIGYTNAGKSTILNALTKSNILAEDKLFATLDTTTRELWIGPQKIGLISDTVGFIQQLPHLLIKAFKSTLTELEHADLLLHVIDISDAKWEEDIRVVHEILEELNVHKEMLYVFNKIDKVAHRDEIIPKLERYQPYVIVSGLSKDGIQPLAEYLCSWKKSREAVAE